MTSQKIQENFRWITPILLTISLFILGYLAKEVSASRLHTDNAIAVHGERPHVGAVNKEQFVEYKDRVDTLTEKISELTIEVRLLRQAINRSSP